MKTLWLLSLLYLKHVTCSSNCVNNDSYVNAHNPQATCRWIRWKENRRKEYCKEQEVHDNCPLTCGVCCEDDPSYEFDCDSIKTEHDLSTYCDGDWFKGRAIRDGCPKSCGFCKTFIVPAVTLALMDDPSTISDENLFLVAMFVVLLILLVFMIAAGYLQIRGKRNARRFIMKKRELVIEDPQPLENLNSFGLPTTTRSKDLSATESYIDVPCRTFDSIATTRISDNDKYDFETDILEMDEQREKSTDWTIIADSMDRENEIKGAREHYVASTRNEARTIIQSLAYDLGSIEQSLNSESEKEIRLNLAESAQIVRSCNSAPLKSLHISHSQDDNVSILGTTSDDSVQSDLKRTTPHYMNRHSSFPG